MESERYSVSAAFFYILNCDFVWFEEFHLGDLSGVRSLGMKSITADDNRLHTKDHRWCWTWCKISKNLSKQCFLPKVSQCNILRQRVFNCLTVCALNRRRMVAPFQSCWLTDSQQSFDSLTTVWLQLFEHMMSSLKELVWQKHSRVPCAFTNVSYTTDLESRPLLSRPQTLALLALTLALMPWIRETV